MLNQQRCCCTAVCILLLTPPLLQPLPHGQLMNYPMFVTEDGAVGALPGAEDFPDLGGKILGTKSAVLPGMLTS